MLVASACLGCDAGDKDNEPTTPPPPLHVTRLLAFDDAGNVIELERAPTKTVAGNTSFRLQFDRFLLPLTVIRQAICLQRRIGPVETADDCTAPVSLTATYDPVGSGNGGQATPEAIYRLQKPASAGSIIPLTAGGTYQLTVLQPTTPDSEGFFAFDGAAIIDPPTFEFKVSSKAPGADPDPAPNAGTVWCTDKNFAGPHYSLTNSCAYDGCHVVHGDFRPPMDLQWAAANLLDQEAAADAIRRTAIDHIAHETQEGEHASSEQAAPDRFGRAMPIVDSRSAGNSYVLYKLLINADPSGKAFIEGAERDRLRNDLVLGSPMPNPVQKGLPNAITFEQLQFMSLWIQGGATIKHCP